MRVFTPFRAAFTLHTALSSRPRARGAFQTRRRSCPSVAPLVRNRPALRASRASLAVMSSDPWTRARRAYDPFDARAVDVVDDVVVALEALRESSCEDLLERAFLRSFERALDADALPRWRDGCAVPVSVDSLEDDGEEAETAEARERVDAWTRTSAAPATLAFAEWVSMARVKARNFCMRVRGTEDVEDARVRAFDREFQEVVGAMCNARGPSRLSAILSAWYRARAREFDRAVRKRWGETSDDEENDAMETSVLERQTSIGADIAGCVEVMGLEWSAETRGMLFACQGCHKSLGRVAENAAARAVGECVKQHVVRRCHGVFDSPKLRPTLRWVRAVPLEYFKTALALKRGDGAAIESWRGRLEYAVHEHLGALRIHELFDVIVEYPDSMPAITDLRTCLQNTTLHAELVDSFVDATRSRLLHAGASTVDIVQQYIGTIKTLLELDPSGVVLELVSPPVKEYLRERKDTIRCVVTMMTDDGGDSDGDGEGALYVELGRLASGEITGNGESSVPAPNPNAGAGAMDNLDRMDSITAEMVAIASEMNVDDVHEDEPTVQQQIMSGWDAWEPEPVETEAAASRGRRRKTGDIIGLLVGIYGSKELFINEYRTMLAEKLLGKANYDTDREMHALELLKLRFGEVSLHNCEVMLKDFADSKRANANIKTRPVGGTPTSKDKRTSDILAQTPVEATIVSALFWPTFSNDVTDFKLPPEIQEHMDAYARRYHQIKAPRKMEWKPALGTVVMDVTHNDRTFEVSVNPVQASILHYFQRSKTWRAKDLAEALGVSVDALRKRIVVWMNHGVLVERKEGHEMVYALSEASGEVDDMGGVHDEDEPASGVASAEETAAAGMMVYEQYVMGMLTNFPSLPLDRIHNMLKMFVVEPVYDKSVDELEAFLVGLVSQGKLAMDGTSFAKK